MKTYTPPPILPHILDQHFDEAINLWQMRWTYFNHLDWRLWELAELEQRLFHNLASLQGGGETGSALLLEALRDSELCGLAILGLSKMASLNFVDQILLAFDQIDPDSILEFERGLRFLPLTNSLIERMSVYCQHEHSWIRAVALAFIARHGLKIKADWEKLYNDCDGSQERIFILQAASHSGALASLFRIGSSDEEPSVREATFRLAAQIGLPSLIEHCQSLVKSQNPLAVHAYRTLAVLGCNSILGDHVNTCADPNALIEALGILGSPQTLSPLIDAMSEPSTGVMAGKAFHRITACPDLYGTQKTTPPADLDAFEQEFWEAQPLPDPHRARSWYQANAGSLSNECYYQTGLAVAEPTILASDLPLGVRNDLWVRFRFRDATFLPGFDPETWAYIQKEKLDTLVEVN